MNRNETDPTTGAPDTRPLESRKRVIGGRTDEDTGESIDPTLEEAYWREEYLTRPYFEEGFTFDDYGPAYGYGVESYSRHPGKTFDEVESDLADDWQRSKCKSGLTWEKAKHAARDAWQRLSDAIERATPGDSDDDGK